ncbi:MAG: hypothetical protein ACRDG3_01465 [Tepidiformaceae bacterium]
MAVTREGIHAALSGVRDDIAEYIPDRQLTRIEPVECPGLSRYGIYSVNHLSPYKPILHYIGYAEGERAFVLDEDPEAFLAMAAVDNVSLNSAAEAAKYGAAFVTVTRPLTRLTYVVESIGDVRFRPKLSDAEQERRNAFEKQYGDSIAPPAAERERSGYRVVLYLVVEQELRRITLHVTGAGAVDADAAVLETGLPLVAGI